MNVKNDTTAIATGWTTLIWALAVLLVTIPASGGAYLPPVPVDVPQGVIAWWTMDDDVTGDFLGAHPLGCYSGLCPVLVEGYVDGAALFNNRWMYAAHDDAFNIGPGRQLTIEGWINPSPAPAQPLAAKMVQDASYFGYQLSVEDAGGGQFQLALQGCDTCQCYDFQSFDTSSWNQWTHVAMTVTPSNGQRSSIRLYVNGMATDFEFLCGAENEEPLLIGYNTAWAGPQLFSGMIDELTVYSRALTAAEISAIHGAGAAGKYKNDCNDNHYPDNLDILEGYSVDLTGDGVPDDCVLAEGPILYVDGDAPLGGDGGSWENAVNDLRAALRWAASGDERGIPVAEIWVKAATVPYRPAGPPVYNQDLSFELVDGVAVYGGFAGGETSPDQRDPLRNVTVLSGDLQGNDGPDFSGHEENSIYVVTARWTDATAILDGFTVSDGGAASAGFAIVSGGGITIEDGDATISNCIISTNIGEHGGGITCVAAGPVIRGCEIRQNKLVDIGILSAVGGAGISSYGGNPQVSNCLIALNDCERGGGGLFIGGGNLLISNCTISDNQAITGGGIHADGANATVVNCAIAGNTARSEGGGAFIEGSSLAMINCTFSGNTAPGFGSQGGAIYSSSNWSMWNSIVWNNTPAEIVAVAGAPIVEYSDVRGGWPGIGNIDADPLFVGPASENYRLRSGSPCVDAGNNAALPLDIADLDGDKDTTEPLPVDLDGAERRIDDPSTSDTGAGDMPIVDMGAYEAAPYCLGELLPPPDGVSGDDVDYAATVAASTFEPAAFDHPCVAGEGDTCSPGFIASDPGKVAEIDWHYQTPDGASGHMLETYVIGFCAFEADDPDTDPYRAAGVTYFKAYSRANVVLNELYDESNVVVHYNSTIREDPSGGAIEGEPPDVQIIGSQFQVSENCPFGQIVLEYNEYAGGPLVGVEVVTISGQGARLFRPDLDCRVADCPEGITPGSVPIGRELPIPTEIAETQDACRAVIVRNVEQDGVPVAHQIGLDTTDIYPIRPESNPNKLVVAWYETTALENCWPAAVYRYTADWPFDPQLHVIDQSAGVGETPAGSMVEIPQDVYCGAEVMYQEGYGSDPDDPPFAYLTADGKFAARRPGYSVLRVDIQPDEVSNCGDLAFFEVVASYNHFDLHVHAGTNGGSVGTQLYDDVDTDGLPDPEEVDPLPIQFPFGYVKKGRPYAVDIYEQTGQIIPVNESHDGASDETHLLEIWWSQEGQFASGIYWPYKVVRYDCQWPDSDDPDDPTDDTANPTDDTIVIAAKSGAGAYPLGATIYELGAKATSASDQFSVRGWNPNDEHAILLPDEDGEFLEVFAVRDDNPWNLNPNGSGHPYVLVQYPDPDDGSLWRMGVHKVAAKNSVTDFWYNDIVAGQPVDPLFPVNFGAPVCFDNQVPPQPSTWIGPIPPSPLLRGEALWVDNKGGVWAVEEKHDHDPTLASEAYVYLWENWGTDGGCQPWLVNGPDACCNDISSGCNDIEHCGDVDGDSQPDPWPIVYAPSWPQYEPREGAGCPDLMEPCAPLRHVGDTIDRSGQCGSITVLHDSVNVKIVDPTHEVSVEYGELPLAVNFAKLPPHLYAGEIAGGEALPDRIHYDFGDRRLYFRGVMSEADKEQLLRLGADLAGGDLTTFQSNVDDLYVKSRAQVDKTITICHGGEDDGKLCSSSADCNGSECGPFVATNNKFVSLSHRDVLVTHPDVPDLGGWVTLALQNDRECTDAGLPVDVEVWRVECPPDKGFIRPIQPRCPLNEKLVLQFSGDAGGEPQNLYYQWQWSVDYDPLRPAKATWNPWLEGVPGVREVLIEGASQFTLRDTYWRVRYRGYAGCGCTEGIDCNEYHDPLDADDEWADTNGLGTMISDWTDVQLAEGWVKRVVRNVNLFDQRAEQFHINDAATYVDMIRQAGMRFEDLVALNCDPDNIDNVGLIELYETVLRRVRDFSIDGSDPASVLPKAFQSIQLASGKISDLYMLLGNEAFADATDPTVGIFADPNDPGAFFDAHAMFCFENQVPTPLDEELALLRGRDIVTPVTYDGDGRRIATVYNRLPWNLTSDSGQIAYANNYEVTDIAEARTLYPQGHGDAWGHYLQALRRFYDLLRHDYFVWQVDAEDVLVAGQIVPVGYKYERKFIHAAAAKARTGAAITSLTFRQRYTPESEQQRRGFPDSDPLRAWGVADWARRAGQGAYFDWVMGTALLPEYDESRFCGANGEVCVSDADCPKECEVDMACSISGIPCTPTGGCPPGETCEDVKFWSSTGFSCSDDGDCDRDESCDPSMSCSLTGDPCESAADCVNYCVDHLDTIHQIDRTTAPELAEIASAATEIQSVLDNADAGLNPLGLSANVVPFALNPKEIEEGKTHFDQVFARAIVALNNAATAFDYANQNTQRIKSIQDNAERFDQLVEEREMDYDNRLIEIFGRPYPEDVGVGGAYPDGYEGPDLFHFAYVEPSELTSSVSATKSITRTFDIQDFGGFGLVGSGKITFNVDVDGGLGLVKPATWGKRPQPGELQLAHSAFLQSIGQYKQAIERFGLLIDQLVDQEQLLQDLYDLNDDIILEMERGKAKQIRLNDLIYDARRLQTEWQMVMTRV